MQASAPARSRTMTLTASQAIILYLSKQRVEDLNGDILPMFGGVYGIFGHGNVSGIGEALWEYREVLPFLRGQSEQGMAHSAIAFAKASRCRRMMAVTSSIGPGATNMITACALAHVNRLPCLFLPGDTFASRRPDPVLQQLEHDRSPNITVNDCFIPVSRYFDRITRPEQLIDSLPQAMRTLLDPVSRGPVTLSLPQDTQTEVFDYPTEMFEEVIHPVRRPEADKGELERAAKVLRGAKRPLIIAGGGVHYSGAEKSLQGFASQHGIPVGESQAGKGSLPWNHPMCLDGIGVTGTRAANEIAAKADVILCVGTRLSDFTTASKSLFHRPGVRFVGLNVNSFDGIKGSAETVTGDAMRSLEALSEELGTWRSDSSYLDEIDRARSQWFSERKQLLAPTSTIPSDAQVLGTLNHIAQDHDIVVSAAGGLPGELHKHWQTSDPIGYHLEYGYSCMGYEIAGGVGVKLAHPDREVYVLVGDGSYLMLHTELLTSLQLGIKINVVLLDNHGFGCINRLQGACGQPSFGNLFPESSPDIDFVASARSYGAKACKVGSLEELEKALKANKSETRSCVTVIETDPSKSSPGSAWWDVAVAQTSTEPSVNAASVRYQEKRQELL